MGVEKLLKENYGFNLRERVNIYTGGVLAIPLGALPGLIVGYYSAKQLREKRLNKEYNLKPSHL